MDTTHTSNGQVNRIDGADAKAPRKAKAKAEATPRPKMTAEERAARKAQREADAQRQADGRAAVRRARWAGGVCATVGLALLALSVVDCTTAVQAAAGCSWGLALLVALGVDGGMVAAEAWLLCTPGTTAHREAGGWAHGLVAGVVLASMALNAWAMCQHAAAGMGWAAVLLGVGVPAAVYTLGRLAGAGLLARTAAE